MNDASLKAIEDSIIVNAPIERAWHALTEEEHVARWLGCLNYKKLIGHVFYMQPDASRREKGDTEGATHCEILTLDEPHCFRFSWYLPGTPKTEVAIELTSIANDKTEATLRHSGWNQFQAQEIQHVWEMLSKGWKSAVLPNFRTAAEATE